MTPEVRAVGGRRTRSTSARIVLMLIASIGAVFGGLLVWQVACDPIGLGGDCIPWVRSPPTATESLLAGSPKDSDRTGRFIGYSGFNAVELNIVHPERGNQRTLIRYVEADQPSTGPLVVSVDPIDKFTWAAASLSRLTNRCFLIRWQLDRNNPQYGGATFGALPAGANCRASAITVANTSGDHWPYIPVRQGRLIGEGAAVVAGGISLL